MLATQSAQNTHSNPEYARDVDLQFSILHRGRRVRVKRGEYHTGDDVRTQLV